MGTKLKILEGKLTAYQLSQALDVTMEMANDLLAEKISVQELDTDVQEKVAILEEALFDQQ